MRPIPYPLRGLWLINDEGADLVMRVWTAARETGKAERIALALEQRDGQPFNNTRDCFVTDAGVAVMDVDGPLMRKAELMSDVSGATSYQWIGSTVDQLREDPNVRKVIIRSNSPGGEAAGCKACAQKIAELAAVKHVEGYIETIGASAMYWLLSQCTHVTAHVTGRAGWIGAVQWLVDKAGQDEQAGLKRYEFVSVGAENKRSWPIDDAVKQRIQDEVDTWGRFFTEDVAQGRGVTPKTVLEKFGRGAGMFAAEALEAGLIDDVDDFDSLLARLESGSATTKSGSTQLRRVAHEDTMTMKTGTVAEADKSGGEWQCAGCNEMMGQSAKAYCAKCSDDDGDEDDDEDEDESKALGLDPKASLGARRARMTSLLALETQLVALTGDKDHEAVVATVKEAMGARAEVAGVRELGMKTTLRAALERGLAGAPGKQPTLSLGVIQRNMAVALRGQAKKSWTAAMEKLAADADVADQAARSAKTPDDAKAAAEKAKLTADKVITAACSVKLSAEDLESIQDFINTSPPVAALAFREPQRNGEDESAELDEASARIKKLADQARAQLDQNKVK